MMSTLFKSKRQCKFGAFSILFAAALFMGYWTPVQADTYWTSGAAPDNSWFNGDNWDSGLPPDEYVGWTTLNGGFVGEAAPLIQAGDPPAFASEFLAVGGWEPTVNHFYMTGGELTVGTIVIAMGLPSEGRVFTSGGTVTATGDIYVGERGIGVWEMSGGSVFADRFYISHKEESVFGGEMLLSDGDITAREFYVGNEISPGRMLMTGGTVTVSEWLWIPRLSGARGELKLYGGTIQTANVGIYEGFTLVDFEAGELVVDGDQTSLFAQAVSNGSFVGFSGRGSVSYTFDGTQTRATGTYASPEDVAYAFMPTPNNGQTNVDALPTLSWRAGHFATSHDVYFGTSLSAVQNATPSTIGVFKGNQTATTFTPSSELLLGTTYYWRIDERDAVNVYKGTVWSFTVYDTTIASEPSPVDGALNVPAAGTILTWTPGTTAIGHKVYLGRNQAAVIAGDPAVLRGTFPTASYDPGTLIKGATYYWRIDEVDAVNTYPGRVWSFTVEPALGNFTWTNGDPGNNFWNSPLNWAQNDLPGAGSNVYIDVAGTTCVIQSGIEAVATGTLLVGSIRTNVTLSITGGSLDTGTWVLSQNTSASGSKVIMSGGTAKADSLEIGAKRNAQFDMSGGQLNVTGNLFLSRLSGGVGTMNLSGGVINCGTFFCGNEITTGTLNMTGGQINIATILWVPRLPAGKGTVNLSGGTITCSSIGTNELAASTNSLVDIRNNGTLVVRGDARGVVAVGVNAGKIVAYGGAGEVSVNYNESNDTTVVTAISPSYSRYPVPLRDSLDIARNTKLYWTPGDGATSQILYFSSNEALVQAKDTSVRYTGISGNTFDPGLLDEDTAYYWRVDPSVSLPDSQVWQFTTGVHTVVDDFISYTTTSALLAAWPCNVSQSLTLDADNTKRMVFQYDNAVSPYFTQAQRTFASPQDWTVNQRRALGILFSPSALTDADTMFVKVQDAAGNSKALYYDAVANPVLAGGWYLWDIDLQDFTGVNLVQVSKLTLGFGYPANPVSGIAGEVSIEDIRLYPSRCLWDQAAATGDVFEDCIIDLNDFSVLAEEWLSTSPVNADISGNGSVSVDDLSIMAGNWLDDFFWP